MLEEYPEVLCVEDAMEILRMSRGSVYALLISGKMKSFRNGRIWRIPKESVKRFILEQSGLL